MNLEISYIQRDLFTLPKRYYLAHCISSDCAMGAGIAVEFCNRFNLRAQLAAMSEDEKVHPTCIRVGRVLNLITKHRSFEKPTLETMRGSLEALKKITQTDGIEIIGTYELGCNLDRLSWPNVEALIKDVFKDTNVKFLICRQ